MKSAEEFLANLDRQPDANLDGASASCKAGECGAYNAEQYALLQQIESKAVALLAMREHGAKELRAKLHKKFPETEAMLARVSASPGLVASLVDDVITRCRENNWQSDERFLEQAVRNYAEKGQGPLKIQQKLQQACDDIHLIHAFLDWDESEWVEIAREVLIKKYGDCQKPASPKEQAKRLRFLQSRGFNSGTVWKTFCG